MNQNEGNDYRRTNYGDYRYMERDVADVREVNQATGARIFVNRVYNWMFCGLLVSTLVAWGVYQYIGGSKMRLEQLRSVAIPLIIFELILVFALSAGIRRISAPVAGVFFVAYAAMNGVTLTPILLYYTESSVFLAFGSCALMFAATSTFGYMTRMRLDTLGSYCMMGLIGIIVASIVNFFWANSVLDWVITYVGIAIFVGLTAWDTQRVRMVGEAAGEEAQSDNMRKVAIAFALNLYLDFINLFLYLLRIFGNRR